VTKNAPSLRVIRADEGIAPIPMLESMRIAPAPSAGKKAHEHKEGVNDPHVWCSPKNAVLIASNILGGLIAADPEGDADYRAGYESLLKDIVALDEELTALFSGRGGMRFLVFHPAWGYFARDYGLVQLSVEVEGKNLARGSSADHEDRGGRGRPGFFRRPGRSEERGGTIADALGAKIAAADPLASDWMAKYARRRRGLFCGVEMRRC
jgi:zinc transport system substrate-binding protein